MAKSGGGGGRGGKYFGKFKKGDVVVPKAAGAGAGIRSRVVGRRGNFLRIRPINARPGSFADNEFIIHPSNAQIV